MAASRSHAFGRLVWIDCGGVRLPVHASWNRHEGLRVAPHSVLADVQTFHLLACRDTQADRLLDDPEDPVAEHEHRRERGAERDRLRPELVEAARVEEAALAHP